MAWLWVPLGVAVLGLFLYWALVLTEGAYLGRRVVALLYDLTPAYYDRVKAITWRDDEEWLVTPLLDRLEKVVCPLVLDVGTGTGRFPAALLGSERFAGQVWGLDISFGMLQRARVRLASLANRWRLIWHDADSLPFPGETFDAVVCLETLEFTPRPQRTLGELVRVLRPGGVLMVSNRIGRARAFPGRVYDDEALLNVLSPHPLVHAQIHNWNSFYDLVWARKEGKPERMGHGAGDLASWVRPPGECVVREGIVSLRGLVDGS